MNAQVRTAVVVVIISFITSCMALGVFRYSLQQALWHACVDWQSLVVGLDPRSTLVECQRETKIANLAQTYTKN
jgi:hypothetical protein